LLWFILEDDDFPREIEKVIASAFLQIDNAFAEACSLDSALASGTTALAALVVGRSGFLNPCVIAYMCKSFFLGTLLYIWFLFI